MIPVLGPMLLTSFSEQVSLLVMIPVLGPMLLTSFSEQVSLNMEVGLGWF